MKVRILMAALAFTLMLGVRGYANPCDSACVDPCGACNGCVGGNGGLFSGLKRLVNGGRINNCDPCDAVVACNPCDEVSCDPCNVACDLPRFGLGSRLRNLLTAPSYCTPCNGAGNCFDANCGPCDFAARNCDPCNGADYCGNDYCGPSRLSLRSLNPFKGLQLNRGCFDGCDPCNGAGNCFNANCDPCGNARNCFNANCGPCNGAGNCFDANCGPCDFADCNGNYCGPRGHLIDLPRLNLSKLFSGLRVVRCSASDCGPCDNVQPCNGINCR